MTITRIGIVPGDGGLPVISKAVVRGDTVYLCGVTPDPVGDVAAQTRQVLERIDRLLAAAGTDKSKLLTRAGLARRHEPVRGAQRRVERLGRPRESAGARVRGGAALPARDAGRDHGDRAAVAP